MRFYGQQHWRSRSQDTAIINVADLWMMTATKIAVTMSRWVYTKLSHQRFYWHRPEYTLRWPISHCFWRLFMWLWNLAAERCYRGSPKNKKRICKSDIVHTHLSRAGKSLHWRSNLKPLFLLNRISYADFWEFCIFVSVKMKSLGHHKFPLNNPKSRQQLSIILTLSTAACLRMHCF